MPGIKMTPPRKPTRESFTPTAILSGPSQRPVACSSRTSCPKQVVSKRSLRRDLHLQSVESQQRPLVPRRNRGTRASSTIVTAGRVRPSAPVAWCPMQHRRTWRRTTKEKIHFVVWFLRPLQVPSARPGPENAFSSAATVAAPADVFSKSLLSGAS